MSYRRRHRWFRRMALGLAFASVLAAGRVSVAAAKFDEGTSGSRYVAAGGWSGQVDMESGIPMSAGIPHGDEQFIDSQAVQVIPYLSHGMLTESDELAFANAVIAAAESLHDPIGPGELGAVAAATAIHDRYPVGSTRPDGDTLAIRNAIEAQTLAAAAGKAIHDRYPIGSSRPDGDTIAIRNAVEAQTLAAAEAIHDPFVSPGLVDQAQLLATVEAIHDPFVSPGVLGEAVKTNLADVRFTPGVTDFPTTPQPAPDNRVERALEPGPQVIPYLSQGLTAADVVGARPDDRADRFAHSDVQTPLEVSSSGSTFEWNDALTVGIGALVLVLGLGLALGYLRRPRLAGL